MASPTLPGGRTLYGLNSRRCIPGLGQKQYAPESASKAGLQWCRDCVMQRWQLPAKQAAFAGARGLLCWPGDGAGEWVTGLMR